MVCVEAWPVALCLLNSSEIPLESEGVGVAFATDLNLQRFL